MHARPLTVSLDREARTHFAAHSSVRSVFLLPVGGIRSVNLDAAPTCGRSITLDSLPKVGQQKGSKRPKSSLRKRAQITAEGSQTRMNRAIARQWLPIVVSAEQACHAGGRGFESRRSR